MGSTLHHDDSLNDRTPGGILDQSYKSTKQMWLDEFGEEYVVEGGMYRGEPPTEYFSNSPSSVAWNDVPPCIMPLTNVREMGASSTSPNNLPTKWAVVTIPPRSTVPTYIGYTSDGSRAFIHPSKQGNRAVLSGEEHKENYILGTFKGVVGYYHVETKEAHIIMQARLLNRNNQLIHDIAMEKCCCGGNPKIIACMEAELMNGKKVYAEITARLQASKPSGAVGMSSGVQFHDSSGAWLYPAMVWDSCGGACGGHVACSIPGGAAACGGEYSLLCRI
jgi:hypothetical protein